MTISTLLVVALAVTCRSAAAQAPSTMRSSDLLAMDPRALARFLDERRPAPLPPDVRSRVLAALPRQGEVYDFDEAERRKLAALAPVLEAARRGSVYAIKVIEVPQARVGLHARTVVLISRSALGLMSEDELRAVTAHETAHEYVHDEYQRARADGRSGRLHDLELVCDIIAVMTLRAIGHEARPLASGIEKLNRYNDVRFGTGIEDPQYPSSLLRRSVILALEKRLSRGDSGTGR